MRVLSAILLFFISINSFCQWQQTEGPITNIRIADILSYHSLLVASAPCGTFISMNNGDSWSPVYPESFSAHTVFKNELYLGGESIRKMIQANENWQESYSLYKRGKTFDLYSDNQHIYAALEKSGFNYSTDGKNWNSYNEGLPRDLRHTTSTTTYYTYDLYAIEGNENYIFAGTREGVYRTLKSNLNWEEINSNLDNTKVNAILCFDSVVFIAKENKIFKSADNGTSWQLSHTFSSANRINQLLSINDSIYALTHLEGIYSSNNAGNDWVAENNGLRSLSTFSITKHNNTFFLANEDGVFKDLVNWQKVSRNIICSHIIDLEKNDSCFAAVDFYNVSITKDKGLTWKNSTDSISMGIVRNVVNLNNTLLFSALGPGLGPKKDLNYTSENNGDTWLAKTDLPHYDDPYKLRTNGNDVIAVEDNFVYLSRDKGTTWKDISPPEGMVCNMLDDALFVGNDIYVLACGNKEIIKTSDFGLSWSFVNEGLPNERVYRLGECQGILFAATDSYLFRLENQSKSWEYSGKGFPKYRHDISTSVNDFTSNEQYFFLCTPDSVYASNNQGRTWSNINRGLPKLPNHLWSGALLVDENMLYYGTNNYGVWKLNLSEIHLPEDTLKEVADLLIYPNPARDMIYFDFPQNDVGEKIELIDFSGRVIYSSVLNENKFSIGNIPPGLYIIRIQTLRNEFFYSKIYKVE